MTDTNGVDDTTMSEYIEFHCLLTPVDRLSAYKSKGTTFAQVRVDSGGPTPEILLGVREMRELGQWFIQKANELESSVNEGCDV